MAVDFQSMALAPTSHKQLPKYQCPQPVGSRSSYRSQGAAQIPRASPTAAPPPLITWEQSPEQGQERKQRGMGSAGNHRRRRQGGRGRAEAWARTVELRTLWVLL